MKMTDKSLARKICKDINTILLKNRITEFKVFPKNLEQLTNGVIIWFDPCPFKKYFYSKHVGKLKHIYAYKKAKRLVDMIKNDELHLTNLFLNEGNDPSEFSEVLLRCGQLRNFIPDDYCAQANKCSSSSCSNPVWFNSANGTLPIDDIRKKIFIYCFTSTFNKAKHWFEYADEDKGICAEYDIDIKNGIANQFIHFGRVHYDKGYDFEFVKEITNMIRKKYNLGFTPIGITKMAMMYKRNKYNWEDELRIVANSEDSVVNTIITNNSNYFSLVNNNVLKIKNHNPYITWEIKRVMLGNRITPKDKAAIEKVCHSKGITVD